jgi:hypothetical protein
MRSATIISVTPDRQLELPPEVRAQLTPGDEYLIWQTEDTIVFKRIHQPLDIDEIFRRIDAMGPDPEQPSEEEICQMVREVRRYQSIHESTA